MISLVLIFVEFFNLGTYLFLEFLGLKVDLNSKFTVHFNDSLDLILIGLNLLFKLADQFLELIGFKTSL
jgi:hypothetical protein